jgi:hypothetical protein
MLVLTCVRVVRVPALEGPDQWNADEYKLHIDQLVNSILIPISNPTQ